ncbi:uncharacterized protein BJ212DRAFT_578737 [Suillus subaureus]|uniref:Uncharacterized protein n=1 Tax=Suillus subaureus TaxID=48587 RepID=A0A9P7E4L0_9AGAM|nr:uncharacterized protein BJ212DRAFT_578737 [Suillus subaureus]KAG1810959.1 hypothetical protein BJ212DRAFT_578737 [Suillus subaureus]
MSKDKLLGAVVSVGFGFCSLIFGWDIHDPVCTQELTISNKENGYCDLMASIDLSTFRCIPWENNVLFSLVSFFDPKTSAPICADPRGVLHGCSWYGMYFWCAV